VEVKAEEGTIAGRGTIQFADISRFRIIREKGRGGNGRLQVAISF
jgi:hypothetical protein